MVTKNINAFAFILNKSYKFSTISISVAIASMLLTVIFSNYFTNKYPINEPNTFDFYF